MQILLAFAAVLAGMASALQSGSNGTLAKSIGVPIWALAIVSGVTFGCSLATVLGGMVFAGQRPPDAGALAGVPWWAWIGGVFGLVFLLATIFVAPKLGAAIFVATVVTASTVTSLVLDNWGLMGFQVHEAGWGRIAGGLLMVGGVVLIAVF